MWDKSLMFYFYKMSLSAIHVLRTVSFYFYYYYKHLDGPIHERQWVCSVKVNANGVTFANNLNGQRWAELQANRLQKLKWILKHGFTGKELCYFVSWLPKKVKRAFCVSGGWLRAFQTDGGNRDWLETATNESISQSEPREGGAVEYGNFGFSTDSLDNSFSCHSFKAVNVVSTPRLKFEGVQWKTRSACCPWPMSVCAIRPWRRSSST